MNLFAQGLLDSPVGLFAALLVGLGFGFWLERAGFGSSRRLTAIFYLQDFAVLKVMFVAMATAAVVLHAAAAAGLLDLDALFVPPTAIGPQLVGGLLFGAGFVVGGWCPGTAAVGVASGKLDALVFLLGAGAGTLLFAPLQPELAGFLQSGACASSSLAAQCGAPPLLGAFVLLGVALAAGLGAGRLEKHMARRQA